MGRRAAGAVAYAIAVAQEENRERMNALEEAIKVLSEKMVETNRRVDALEEAVKDMSGAIKALGEKMVEHQLATERQISSATGWAMLWKMAFLQAPLYVAMLGRFMQWW